MHNCALCKNPISLLAEWRGKDGRFYCSEFCAEAGENVESLAASPTPEVDTGLDQNFFGS
jgi:hypothetical protein